MVKVKINWQGQVVDFDLNRDLPLQTIVDAICTQLNVAPPKTDYSLQVDGAPQHISQQVRHQKKQKKPFPFFLFLASNCCFFAAIFLKIFIFSSVAQPFYSIAANVRITCFQQAPHVVLLIRFSF